MGWSKSGWSCSLVATVLAVSGGVEAVRAQVLMPPELEVSAWSHTNACVLYPPVASPEQFIRAEVTFVNASENKVRIAWRFKTGLGSGRLSTEHDVAFKPTAVCARAGRSDTLFVVGWSERSGEVEVEQWTLTGTSFLETVLPSGDTRVSLVGPKVRRSHIVSTDQLSPVACAAANPFSGELYLLEEPTPRSIRVLDVATGELSPAPLVDELQEPTLGSQLSIIAGFADGKFVVYTSEKRRVTDPRHAPDQPWTTCWFLDANLDGVFDSAGVGSYEAFKTRYTGLWDLQFEAP